MAKTNGWVTFSDGSKKQFKATSPKRAGGIAKDILKSLCLKRDDIKNETQGALRITKVIFGKRKRVLFCEKEEQAKAKHRGDYNKRFRDIGRRQHCVRRPKDNFSLAA